jgi:hypothetical protein
MQGMIKFKIYFLKNLLQIKYILKSPRVSSSKNFFFIKLLDCYHPSILKQRVKETFFLDVKIDCVSIREFISFLFAFQQFSLPVISRAYVFVFDPSCVVFAFTFQCTQFFFCVLYEGALEAIFIDFREYQEIQLHHQ